MSDYWPVPVFKKHGTFLRSVTEMLYKSVIFGSDKKNKVILWKDPEELKNILDLTTNENALTHGALLKFIENTIEYSVRTGHPYFINQLFSGLDAYGLAAQWVTDALNPSVYTYEVAPVFTLMEQAILKEFCQMVRFPEGDGLFCPGGSLSNGLAINVARFNYYPDVKHLWHSAMKQISVYDQPYTALKGVGSEGATRVFYLLNSNLGPQYDTLPQSYKLGMCSTPKLCIFTSEESHYSVQKMASLLGIGESNVIEIATDHIGCMIPSDLQQAISKQISEGSAPLMVVATLGTTVRGAFDPINEIADICDKYNMWLHVDAAWGGGIIFSSVHKHKLNGIERANSIAINPHKLLAVPQQCSMLLVKNGDLLKECHSKHAQYLFQKDKFYDISYDIGDKYVQCGRKCDVFKFLLMWKAKGSVGFGKHVDDIMDTAKYLTKMIKEMDDFQLVSEPQFVNVCFWYIPKKIQHLRGNNPEFNTILHKVAPQIKELLVKEGNIMINYQPLKQFPNFFRFVSQNSAFNKNDAVYLLKKIAEKGESLEF